MKEKSRKPWIIAAVLMLVGVIWLIARNEEEIDAFADGITGNQAVREGQRMEDQVRTISNDHMRQLEDMTDE